VIFHFNKFYIKTQDEINEREYLVASTLADSLSSRGQRIAFIGESGSGKSTLLALLRGMYTPEAGATMLVDDRLAELAALHAIITLVPQEPEIFENTIRYNITIGLPFNDADINNAADLARS
jgi:ABC-type multidrug transport system fused ATPase/permease subunit